MLALLIAFVPTPMEADAIRWYGSFDNNYGLVQAMSFSADGRWLAIASSKVTTEEKVEPQRPGRRDRVISSKSAYAGRIVVVDVANKKEKLSFQDHQGQIIGVAFSPDNKSLASASIQDGVVRIRNLSDGKGLTFKQPSVTSLSYAPNAECIATGADDGVVSLLNVGSGKLLFSEKLHRDRVTSVLFSSDNSLLFTGSWDQTIRVIDLRTKTMTLLGQENGAIDSLYFSKTGKSIIAKGHGFVSGWNLETKKLHERHLLEEEETSGRSELLVEFQVVASATSRGSVVLKSLSSKRELSSEKKHVGNIMSIAFSPRSSLFASGDDKGLVNLWEFSFK